jgi:hypothetical protein
MPTSVVLVDPSPMRTVPESITAVPMGTRRLPPRSIGRRCRMSSSSHRSHPAGKGDSPRKLDMDAYRKNYEKIFGKKKNPNTSKGKKNSS